MSSRWYPIILLVSLLSCCHGTFSEISIVPITTAGKRNHEDVKLADLYTLFHKDTPPVSKYNLDSCEFELAKDGCKITFLPKEESCKDIMSLGKLTTYLLRTRKLRDLMSKLVPLGVFQIERFYLDKCKKEVEFEAVSKESFEVIREKIKVKSGKLMLNFNYSNFTKHYSFTEIAFDMLGEYDLVGNTVPLTLLKQRGAREADVTIKTDSLKVSQFISVFTKKKVTEDSEIPNMQRFTDVSLDKPIISGKRDAAGSYEIVLKGHLSDLNVFDEATIYVVAQKKINSPVTVAIIINIKQANPGSILTSLTGKELNDIPLLKEVRTNVIVEYATSDITMVKDAMLNKLLFKYISNSNTITKGSKLKVDLPIKKIIRMRKKHFSLKHVPESIYVQVFFYSKTLSLQFPEDYHIGLSKILIVLIPQVPGEIFTNILKIRPRVVIERFDVNINTKSVDLLLSAPNEVMLGNGLIQLENAEFEIGKRVNNSEWDFTIKGSKMIDKVKLDVNVLRMGKDYMFQGKIWELSIRQIANHFGGGLNANEIFDELRFLDFVVKDVLILADFKQDFAKLKIEGMPLLFDWNSHFEGFLVDNGNEKKMAFGVVVSNIHLGDIVKKFFNQSMPQVSWMRDVTVTIVIANDDDENCTECEFVAKELDHARVRKGAFLSTDLLVPDECNGESMCELMKDKMRPGTKLQLDGEINRNGFKLRAPYTAADGIALGIGLLLEEAVFCVEVNLNETRVYIEGILKIVDPHLKFDAKIELAPTGQLELELAMIGQWNGPMKLRNVYFNDVELQMGLVPGRMIKKLEFSGKLHIGGNFSEIIAYSTIGLSIMNSLENYFYADIGTISLPALLGSFNVYLAQLPDVFFRTSFPEGLIIGSTNNPTGKRIDHLGVVLEMGLVMKGLVSILDLTLPCRITISSQKRFDLSANMSFFRLADDLITMQRSQNDMENGPLLDGVISSSEVYLKIGGYVNVLGIGSDAVMEISNKGLQFFVHGNLFKTVETNLTVNAPSFGMGWNVSKSEFYVSSCLSSSIKDITVEARNAVADAAEITEEAVKEAEDQIKNAVTWHTKAKEKLDKWLTKMDDKMKSVQHKSRRMESIKKFLTASCTDRCPEQCVGGFSKKLNCTMLFGEWISCPVWNECKRKLDDPFCLAQCQGKKMYLQGKGMKKKVAMEIVSDVIDNIQTILNKTQEFVAKAQRVVDLTNKASTKIAEVVASGKLAIQAISRHTKEKLVSIQYIGFNTTIERAADSCLELDVSANIGNEPSRRFSTDACLDMKFVKNIGVSIANQLFPGITNLKDKLISAKVALLDAKNEANELDKEIKESEEEEKRILTKVEEVDKEKDYDNDDGRAQKKDSDALNRTSIDYIRSQIFNDLPSFILRDDDIMDSFKRRSPWAFSQQDSPFTEYVNRSDDDADSRSDTGARSLRALKKNSNKSDCIKTKDAVKVYSQISDTISYLVKKATEQKQSYQAAARAYSKKTSAIEKEIATHSQLLDMNPDEKDEAMFFVGKLKDGVAKWMKTLDKQLELQDKESIGTWRNSLTTIVAKKDINMKQFLKIIDSATEGMTKRKEILTNENRVGERLVTAKKLINDLLTDSSGTLHSKRNIVGALVENMFFIKDAMHTFRCIVE